MTTYTIDNENNITAHSSQEEAGDAQGERFASQQEFAGLAANWPAARLVEIWNSIPGLAPVKKFTDRKSAMTRIWKAIQSLNGGSATEAAPTALMAMKRANSAKTAVKSSKKAKSVTKTPAKAVTGKRAKAAGKPVTAREGSKKAEVLGQLRWKGGATLTEIMEATGWQAHTVRGFISGTVGKKMGLTVESTKREDGERVYKTVG
jgi:hypothetical protein